MYALRRRINRLRNLFPTFYRDSGRRTDLETPKNPVAPSSKSSRTAFFEKSGQTTASHKKQPGGPATTDGTKNRPIRLRKRFIPFCEVLSQARPPIPESPNRRVRKLVVYSKSCRPNVRAKRSCPTKNIRERRSVLFPRKRFTTTPRNDLPVTGAKTLNPES